MASLNGSVVVNALDLPSIASARLFIDARTLIWSFENIYFKDSLLPHDEAILDEIKHAARWDLMGLPDGSIHPITQVDIETYIGFFDRNFNGQAKPVCLAPIDLLINALIAQINIYKMGARITARDGLPIDVAIHVNMHESNDHPAVRDDHCDYCMHVAKRRREATISHPPIISWDVKRDMEIYENDNSHINADDDDDDDGVDAHSTDNANAEN